MLEWVALSFSVGTYDPCIEPASTALPGGFFTTELPGKQKNNLSGKFPESKDIYLFCSLRYINLWRKTWHIRNIQ